jgi:peptidoglycan/LPS O-acetylase OafA/YrhL
MGLLRLYLAICVIATHSESVLPWGSHGGREAVQIFFIISGFYMQLILADNGKYQSVWDFYRSRSLRIYVPYLISLAIIVVASISTGLISGEWLTLSATHKQFHEPGNMGAGTIFATLTNGTLLFQDWVMFLDQTAEGKLVFTSNFLNSVRPLWNFLWIPQAWSVGVELTFYITAPFLIRKLSNRALILVAALSLLARFLFYWKLGLFNDPWSYRFFPFELLNFCYGILGCRLMQHHRITFGRITEAAAKIENRIGRSYYPLFLLAGLVGLYAHRLIFTVAGDFAHTLVPRGKELVYFGSLPLWGLLVPVLFSMTRHNRVDRAVGELSYPVYLLHYTVCLLILNCIAWFHFPKTLQGEVAAIFSVAIAILLQIYVLNPFEIWRQSLAKRHAKTVLDTANI